MWTDLGVGAKTAVVHARRPRTPNRLGSCSSPARRDAFRWLGSEPGPEAGAPGVRCVRMNERAGRDYLKSLGTKPAPERMMASASTQPQLRFKWWPKERRDHSRNSNDRR